MRILAIDTALPSVSVCVLDEGAAAPVAIESMAMDKGHAEALMPMVERVMARVDGGFASLDRVAATVGPGSFTGIRIGVAAARGIALARKLDVVGVSTLSAFAAPLLADNADTLVAAAIDARHGHVYFSAYGPGGQLLTSPRVLPLKEACRLLAGGRARVAGSGAMLLRDEGGRANPDIIVANPAASPDIVAVARLGLAADPTAAPARPLYIKPPDVTPSTKPALPRVAS